MAKMIAKGTMAAILAMSVLLTMAIPARVQADDSIYFRIGTGSTAGTYFPVGALIAAIISSPPGSDACDDGGACGVKNLIALATTSQGSIANIEGIAAGRFDSGFAQADIAAWAYLGHPNFWRRGRAMTSLRAIANLYPESVHLVAAQHLGITSVKDLKGRRIAIDRPGSGARSSALAILKAAGLAEDTYTPVTAGPDQTIRALTIGTADAAFLVAGYPSTAVKELTDSGDFTLIPLRLSELAGLKRSNPYFFQHLIPENTYRDTPATPSLAVGAQWVVDASMDPDLIYEVTKSLWRRENRGTLSGGHEKGRLIRRETALQGLSIPLHPGAERYYREAGIVTPE